MTGLLALPAFWSCDDAVNPALSNSIYFQEATKRDEFDCLIKPMRETTYNVQVKMTHKVDHDVKLNIIVDRELLAKHFEEFGEDLPILPTDNWVLYDTEGTPHAGERMEVTFPANQTVAVLPIKILPVENAEESQYALPLTIQSVSENIQVLEKLQSQLFVFQAPFETDAFFWDAYNSGRDNGGTMQGRFPALSTSAWTLEFHYHVERRQDNGEYYGIPMVWLGPSEIYVRYYQKGGMDIHIMGTFGPASYNLANAAGKPADYFTNSEYEGQWDHFALVCERGIITSYINGQQMASTSSAQFDTDFNLQYINIGGTSTEKKIAFSEVRFWSVARTQAQLTRFKYNVDPNAKGLEVYYKMNDCSEDVIKDSSPNGCDIDMSEFRDHHWGRVKTNDDFTSFVTVK